MIRRVLMASALALTMLPPPLQAQRPGRPDRAELEQRIRERFGELVRRELGLGAEQLEELERVVRSFEQQRRELARREGALRRRLRGDATRGDPDGARALLQEIAGVRQDEARLFSDELEALLRTLSPEQALRFYRLREELMERVRRLRPSAMGPAARGRGPPLPAVDGAPR